MNAEMKSKPVWAWLPGRTEPVRCGTFSWRVGLGQFVYDRDYLAGGGALDGQVQDPPPGTIERRPPCTPDDSGIPPAFLSNILARQTNQAGSPLS